MIYSFGLIFGIFCISILLNILLSNDNFIISPAFLCILIAIIYTNLFSLPKNNHVVLNFIINKILKVGIALIGIGLSFNQLLQYGFNSLILIVFNIVIVFITLILIGKALNISKKLLVLISMGTAICGVTAVIATSTIIKSDKNETGYAIGVVTLFGLFAVLCYPYLANYLFNDNNVLAGIFLGTSIHDTAQVSAAGLIYQGTYNANETLNSSMTIKLIRNSFLIIMIPLLAYYFNDSKSKNIKSSLKSFFPMFVLGFVVLSIIRTLGDFYFIETNLNDSWSNLVLILKEISKYLILLSMVALGLQFKFSNFKKLGLKPLLIGFIAALSVGVSSFIFLNFNI
tara:strand:- start:523 stop:1548 length:1026 start_codon:yes stop_codon:yes gene_type:complete